MPSNKPRIATYTTELNLRKFKIISAYKGKSMSDYLSQLINESIEKFESEHGTIELDERPGE